MAAELFSRLSPDVRNGQNFKTVFQQRVVIIQKRLFDSSPGFADHQINYFHISSNAFRCRFCHIL